MIDLITGAEFTRQIQTSKAEAILQSLKRYHFQRMLAKVILWFP